MGTSSIIIPIDEEQIQEMNEWLVDYGFEIPVGITSRYPTPSEIRQVLDEMPEYTKVYSMENLWDVGVYETALYDQEHRSSSGKDAYICSIGPKLDDSLPLHIYFSGGSPEVNLEIVLGLARFTGPLLYINFSDGSPILVFPDEKLADLISKWEKRT